MQPSALARPVSGFVGFVVPSLCNGGLVGTLAWNLATIPRYAQHLSFETFVWFYGVGGLVIVLSCFAAFLLLSTTRPPSARAGGRARWLCVALLNASVPSLVLLLLILLG